MQSSSLLLSVEDEYTFGDLGINKSRRLYGQPKINETANVNEDTKSPNIIVLSSNAITKVYDRKTH